MALINKLTAIGDKIREKLGIKDLINLSDIPAKIEEVFSKGKETQYDAFWDKYQLTSWGTRTNYTMAFAFGGWRKETFIPKYDIKPETAERMFQSFGFQSGEYLDLPSHLRNLNINLDFSNCTRLYYTFSGAFISRLGTIDVSKSETNAYAFNTTSIATIDKLIFSEDTDTTSIFSGASGLSNLTVEGKIGKTISFSPCPLNKKSIISVVTHLSETQTSKTVTFKASAVNSIDWTNTSIDGVTYNSFDEICDLKPNWTISLV